MTTADQHAQPPAPTPTVCAACRNPIDPAATKCHACGTYTPLGLHCDGAAAGKGCAVLALLPVACGVMATIVAWVLWHV